MEKMLTTGEAAEALRITTRTLYAWIKTGKLAARKVGKRWLIAESRVLALLAGDTERVEVA